MIYIKNLSLTKALQNNNILLNTQYKENFNINYFQYLNFIIYIFLYKENVIGSIQ